MDWFPGLRSVHDVRTCDQSAGFPLRLQPGDDGGWGHVFGVAVRFVLRQLRTRAILLVLGPVRDRDVYGHVTHDDHHGGVL